MEHLVEGQTLAAPPVRRWNQENTDKYTKQEWTLTSLDAS
jgi:hypothetical protein